MSPETDTLLTERAPLHGRRVALVGVDGRHSYAELLDASRQVAAALLEGRRDGLAGDRVAYFVPPSCAHVAVQWGIWLAGGVAVPLCLQHPADELRHVVDDSGASAVVVDESAPEQSELRAAASPSVRWIPVGEALARRQAQALPRIAAGQPAMIIYTSGTTGRPKGAVLSHGNLAAQIRALVEAWGWRTADRILSVLPLHPVHGIVNVVACALWAGARCELLPRFDPEAVWRWIEGDAGPSLFMAVPTVYSRLIDSWEAASAERREARSAGCRRLRLMVSGSAALPVSVLQRWQRITGHVLLERYGMTEIGMALSNPLEGQRRPGWVGRPLPRVEVRVVDAAVADVEPGTEGELLVRGPGVFSGYWQRPEETRRAFVEGGWFRTGDLVVEDPADGPAACDAPRGAFRIVGRLSVDIIKTGGYKVSALEIEERLREHPVIRECAVVGVADRRWGQRVAAGIVLVAGQPSIDPEELARWCEQHLAPYKVPRLWRLMERLPRNALGKVKKPELARCFEREGR